MYKIRLTTFALLIFAWPYFASCLTIVPVDKYEKIVLITDRSIYITGEQVQFFATVLNGKNVEKPVLSQILYCEIVAPDGNQIAGGKFLINNSTAAGCVDLPDNLLTGTYYARAYTKLMRNYGPEFYAYSQIRIVNPGRGEILTQENNKNSSTLQVIPAPTIDFKDVLSVSADKNIYAPRDVISLSLSSSLQPENDEVAVFKNLCLSVIPEHSGSQVVNLQSSKKPANDKADYVPETRGLSVSGKLTVASSQVPVPDKKVNLSIIGEGRDFMAARTDSLGRFYFAMPDYSGSRDLFLCAEKIDSLKVKIWVDNDFCTLPIHLPSPDFKLSESERQSVKNMALNEQINSHFYNDSLQKSEGVKDTRYAFYGKPSAVIYIDKYIQLPTLEEYFNELPSEVRVRKHKGEPRFAVLGSRGVSFNDPLVMVDWVAVDEPAKLLAISPQNISRIEVVKDEYVKGGQTYGGIISIISKKGDFAGVDLPSTGIFINYQFLGENECKSTVYDNISSHPDSRNTILWKPGITIMSGNTQKFSFTAPDTPGKYNILLEGMTSKGEIITVKSVFEVSR
jgi:hypothetical protein